MRLLKSTILTGLLAFTFGCSSPKENDQVFNKVTPEVSGVSFTNELPFDEKFNIYTYRNFYNGGGVAIGDIDNDGLSDVYFTGNLVKNKLYKNLGDFKFEDISEKAGVQGDRAWSTGVSMADINGDGFLDIYVCNSGDISGDNKQNELFINNGDGTFSEQAEAYGLADRGFSTHAAFFDYDQDGDLDVYLLNNSYTAIKSFNLRKNIRPVRDEVGGDKLYRNDDGKFTDVSQEAGIYGSVIGFGLGVTVGDVNDDNWLDIFISNDFFERDYLYINNGDGTFDEVLEKSMRSISQASMGADMADINNDGKSDIFVTDMLPEKDERLKQVTTFESWDRYDYGVQNGYHHQFIRNMLHMNNGDGTYTEIGRLAGVEATDWSWGALFFDMDNDGNKDLFVANGIYQDITDLDYLNFAADNNTKAQAIRQEGVDYETLIAPIPVTPIPNYAYKNLGNLKFENKAADWGLGEPVHSNGSAFGDLDNDGDLDLVVNNVNATSNIFRNQTSDKADHNRYLKFELKGKDKNTFAIGTKINIQSEGQQFYIEQVPIRGFQSTVDPRPNVGLGDLKSVDLITVTWPDGQETVLKNEPTNQTLKLNWEDASTSKSIAAENDASVFTAINADELLDFTHEESQFIDFDRDRLTYHMLSNEGPKFAAGDVNGDGLEDVYIGGAKGQTGAVYKQTKAGKYQKMVQPEFEQHKLSEDVDAAFFDMDNDGDQDLIVASGGNEFGVGALQLIDRLYINDGQGNFKSKTDPILSANIWSTAVIAPQDINGDGYMDLFVGSRLRPFLYGVSAPSFIYINNKRGGFENATKDIASMLDNLGMVTDATWSDFDQDGDNDLVIVGEWMNPTVLQNNNGTFKDISANSNLINHKGWYNKVETADIDNDGDDDYILANHGLNSRFRASKEKPIKLFVNDFDQNGSAEQIFTRTIDGKDMPYTLKHELQMQVPAIKKKYLKYEAFKDQSITDIFTPAQLEKAEVSEVYSLATSVMINNGDGTFEVKTLPVEAQLSPSYAISTFDFNEDGNLDILLGGNLHRVKPQVGKYDANYGVLLIGDGKGGFKAMSKKDTGLSIQGEVRDFKVQMLNGERVLLIAMNNEPVKAFKF
ncbi:VCBS repeat-containing protein [Roseivirga sp.]|uniref:VCBS repeat-containing protein n=1 Tax=Roseivirga sp. TaxID=1964215 RepID=UPI003B8B681B